MHRRHLFLVAPILVAGCGVPENSDTSPTTPTTSLTRTQSLIEKPTQPHQAFTASSRVLTANTDFKTPRKVERKEFNAAALVPREEEALKNQAVLIAKQLFPSMELKLNQFNSGRFFSYADFHQYYKNRPIVGAKLKLRLNALGEWQSFHSSLIDVELLENIQEQESFKKELGQDSWLPKGHHILSRTSKVYPHKEDSEEMKFYFAEEIEVLRKKDRHAYYVWLQEGTNEVLGIHHPGTKMETMEFVGSIIPESLESGLEEVAFPFVKFQTEDQKFFADSFGQFKLEELSGLFGHFNLKNSVLAIANNGGEDNFWEGEISPDHSQINIDDHSSLEERNIYYWVTKGRQYMINDLKFNKMNRKMVAIANSGRKRDNASFNPIFNTLEFGTGHRVFNNTAHSKDVILHEYGHAVTHVIYGLQVSYEFRAMNEAFSDYFAATITEDPDIGDDVMKTRPYLRTVENEFVYEDFYEGNYFHRDGQLFSGALWRIREALGPELADQMIHEARLAGATSISEFMEELFVIDEALDDGEWHTPSPHRNSIRDAFFAHGLYSDVQFIPAQEDWTTPWDKTHSPCLQP